MAKKQGSKTSSRPVYEAQPTLQSELNIFIQQHHGKIHTVLSLILVTIALTFNDPATYIVTGCLLFIVFTRYGMLWLLG